MALEVRKGTLNAVTTGTVPVRQNITGLPFQPKAVIFFSASLATATANSSAVIEMFGSAVSSASQFVVANASDAASTTNSGRVNRINTECICLLSNGTPTIDALAKFVSFNADGFSLDWTDVAGSAVAIHYLAIGGTDVTNAAIVEVTPSTTTSGTTQSISFGFQPDCVLTVSPAVPSTTGIVDSNICIGAATRLPSTKQYATTWFDNDGVTTGDALVYSTTQRMGALPSSTAVLDADYSLTSWSATGITITWNDAPASTSPRIYMLALAGGQYDLANVSARTSTGTQSVPVSFLPSGVLLFGSGEITDTDTTASSATTESMFYVGAADSALNQGAVAYNIVDGDTGNSRQQRRQSTTGLWQQVTTTGGTLAAAAAIPAGGLTASNVSLNWSTANTAARKAALLVFGSAATASTVRPTLTLQPMIGA